MGTMERDRLFLKPDAFYKDTNCELILGVAATKIDRATKQVHLADGRALAYDKLLIATGSRVRKIRCPGADLPGVHYLRGIADVDGLRAVFEQGKRLAIVGGGYIGLEVAAVAAKRGIDVTVFEGWTVSWRAPCRFRSPISTIACIAPRREDPARYRRRSLRGQWQDRGDPRQGTALSGGRRSRRHRIVPNEELAREGRPRVRRWHRGRREIQRHRRPGDLRCRRLHPPYRSRRYGAASGMCAERDRPGQARRVANCPGRQTSIAKCRGSGPISTT